jgi:hypothetical protein
MLFYQSSFFKYPDAKQKFHGSFCCCSNGSGSSDAVIISTPSERIVISVSTISFDIVL